MPEAVQIVQYVFMRPVFRVYRSDDIRGVEYGGALKNIVALACGVHGITNPLFAIADETLFIDSFTAASGRPTMNVRGSPFSPELTSTSTGSASTPNNAPEFTLDNIFFADCTY